MKIVVIGHPCYDIIHKGENEIHSYGGIIYSLIGFSIISKSTDTVYPIFNISYEHFEKYLKIFQDHLSMDTRFIEKTNTPINTVHLFFQDENLQFECYQSRQEKIYVYRLKELSSETHFYINMISGFELELEDIKFIRENFSGKIYFDFHTLTRGIDSEGKRFYRPINDWLEWLDQCDVVQMNDFERRSIPPVELTEEEFVNKAFTTRLKVINITKGKDGAITYYKNNEDSWNKVSVTPDMSIKFRSNVGCGDLFGAIFAYEYFRGEEIKNCLERAVLISSKRVELEHIDEIFDLKKLL